MHILGIDYGKKKIGLAVSYDQLTEPLKVIRFEEESEAIKKIEEVIREEQIEKVVIGVSEGKMAEETVKFGKTLEKTLRIPVVFQDETLTTREAQSLSIKAGIKRKKRREMEDAYSAALILQSYLDK